MKISKERAEFIAMVGMVLYFLVEAIQKFSDSAKEEWRLIQKSLQIETYLENTNVPILFRGADFVSRFAWVINFMSGVILLVAACTLAFYQQRQARAWAVQVLLMWLCWDAMVLHQPISEQAKFYQAELSHFIADIALAGGLLMLIGFRH